MLSNGKDSRFPCVSSGALDVDSTDHCLCRTKGLKWHEVSHWYVGWNFPNRTSTQFNGEYCDTDLIYSLIHALSNALLLRSGLPVDTPVVHLTPRANTLGQMVAEVHTICISTPIAGQPSVAYHCRPSNSSNKPNRKLYASNITPISQRKHQHINWNVRLGVTVGLSTTLWRQQSSDKCHRLLFTRN